MKQKITLTVKELNKKVKYLIEEEDDVGLSECYVQLGELFREREPHKAMLYYEKAVAPAQRSNNYLNATIALRNQGELILQLREDSDDSEKNSQTAIRTFKQQLKMAEASKQPELIVAACHTLAANLYDESDRVDESRLYLLEALKFGRKGLNVLVANSAAIDAKSRSDTTCADSKRFAAGLQCVLANICYAFGATKQARIHLAEVNAYTTRSASAKCEPNFYYEYLHAKVDMSKGSEKLAIVKEMLEVANHERKKINVDMCIHLKLHIQQLTCGTTSDRSVFYKLLKFYCDHSKNPACESIIRYLYLHVNMQRLMQKAKEEKERCHLYERAGDQATQAGCFELAYRHYEKMLHSAEKLRDTKQIYDAHVSLATTAFDLHDYTKAKQHQTECLRLRAQFDANNTSKIKREEFDLFLYDYLEQLAANNIHQYDRDTIFGGFKQHLAHNGDVEATELYILDYFILFLGYQQYAPTDVQRYVKEWREKRKSRDDREAELNAIKSDHAVTSKVVTEVSLHKIVKDLKNHLMDLEQRLEDSDVTKRNTYGETDLHQAAKLPDVDRVKRLIQAGHQINSVDHGNFTPLSEAVSHGQMENVRALLLAGANPNIASKEPFVDASPEAFGFTPLMEAVEMNRIDIARLLLRFGANPFQRDNLGKNAVDRLKLAMNQNMETFDLRNPYNELLNAFISTSNNSTNSH